MANKCYNHTLQINPSMRFQAINVCRYMFRYMYIDKAIWSDIGMIGVWLSFIIGPFLYLISIAFYIVSMRLSIGTPSFYNNPKTKYLHYLQAIGYKLILTYLNVNFKMLQPVANIANGSSDAMLQPFNVYTSVEESSIST